MSSRPRKPARPAADPLADLRELDRTVRRAREGSEDPAPVAPPDPDAARRYQDLLEAAVSLSSTLDLGIILDQIVDGIMKVARCERGFLMLLEPDGTFSAFTGRTRAHGEWDRTHALQISETIIRRVVDTREPFFAADIAAMDDMKTSDSILAHAIRSAVCLPLLYKYELIGVIYADSQFVIPQFAESDRAVLRAFGAQAAVAIENGRRHGELRRGRDELEAQNLALRRQLAREFSTAGMISRNKRMQEIFETVAKIAPHDISVLIQGESGTGKELLARAIHDKSLRRNRPFEAVNCAGIPTELVESILFGYKKGAFTGADADRAGVFEVADGGTIFLDEIGDMPYATQPKLLRVLEQREVTRVGEVGQVRKVNVRIIAATNVDLAAAVDQGRFRSDLFYRINAARIELPPLRDRREDIIPLAEHFLSRYAEEKAQPVPRLSPDARTLLLSWAWEGNVRELKNAIDNGIAFQDDHHVIHARDIERSLERHAARPSTAPAGTLKSQIDHYEEQLIRQTLAANGHNVSEAARVLDISRQQLHLKIKKYGIAARD